MTGSAWTFMATLDVAYRGRAASKPNESLNSYFPNRGGVRGGERVRDLV